MRSSKRLGFGAARRELLDDVWIRPLAEQEELNRCIGSARWLVREESHEMGVVFEVRPSHRRIDHTADEVVRAEEVLGNISKRLRVDHLEVLCHFLAEAWFFEP